VGYTVTCWSCGKTYETELDAPPRNRRPTPVKTMFPDAEQYQLEQCISGICSDKCYDKYIIIDPSVFTYDEKGRRFYKGERAVFIPDELIP